jgi:hypothetical protein
LDLEEQVDIMVADMSALEVVRAVQAQLDLYGEQVERFLQQVQPMLQ